MCISSSLNRDIKLEIFLYDLICKLMLYNNKKTMTLRTFTHHFSSHKQLKVISKPTNEKYEFKKKNAINQQDCS